MHESEGSALFSPSLMLRVSNGVLGTITHTEMLFGIMSPKVIACRLVQTDKSIKMN